MKRRENKANNEKLTKEVRISGSSSSKQTEAILDLNSGKIFHLALKIKLQNRNWNESLK